MKPSASKENNTAENTADEVETVGESNRRVVIIWLYLVSDLPLLASQCLWHPSSTLHLESVLTNALASLSTRSVRLWVSSFPFAWVKSAVKKLREILESFSSHDWAAVADKNGSQTSPPTSETCPSSRTSTTESPLLPTPLSPRPVSLLPPKLVRCDSPTLGRW